MEMLITKTSISRLLLCDPQAKILGDLSPIAYFTKRKNQERAVPGSGRGGAEGETSR
jgi:hypothetical protein